MTSPSEVIEKTLLPIKFIIVGGGLSGLSCAVALTRVTAGWGLIDEMCKRSSPHMDTINFYDCKENKWLGRHVYKEDVLRECGDGQWLFLSHTDLRGVLYEAATNGGADIRTGCTVTAIHPASRTVTLANGDNLVADVIIAADGVGGIGRKTLVGRELELSPSGYILYSTTLPLNLVSEVPEIKGGTDDNASAVCVHYGNGICVYSYPVNPAGDLAIHIYGPDDGKGGDWADHSASIVDAVRGQSPWVEKLATLVPPATRVRAYDYEDLEDWVHAGSSRFLAVGAAAHPLPEGSLQSFGMLVEDAAVLGKLFSYLQKEDQIPNILWGFQDIRQPRCVAVKERETYRAKLFTLKYGPEQVSRDQSLSQGADLGLYSLEEPRVLFTYDGDEAGADWWHGWGKLQENARHPRHHVAAPVKVGVEVEIEAAVH
ncbi:hypothetical protein PHLGIDRAFT_172853 [Phlebiopsis gigantea 11061_1 CR5-6]|uniref:FAD-binding domain-containing protein n=1 Tax=Phlebiopsis gigantea (strain 11061_1 CR5-6) TaxID=745531 RepID=A0A0C3SEV8_PHLG1|nr:hypothetical protein PHLGIDRAFT_172853 [Phlebiopsis gigantea 11061_1 CR5-6]